MEKFNFCSHKFIKEIAFKIGQKAIAFKLLLLLFSFQSNAQIKTIQQAILEKENFTSVDLFSTQNHQPENLNNFVADALSLTLDKKELQNILENNFETLSLEIPSNNKNINIKLLEYQLLSKDFFIKTPSENGINENDYKKGKYYRGTIEGETNAWAAISFFEDEIVGIIATAEGNFVLGKLNDSEHLFYLDKKLKIENDFTCGNTEADFEGHENIAIPESVELSCNLVEVYFECDYQTFLDHNSSLTQATNYVTGFFNAVATIFQNERIRMQLSPLFIWNVQDNYPFNNSAAALNAFQDSMLHRGYTGDLAHLLSSRQAGNGGRASVNVLCRNAQNRIAYSNINANALPFPNYSWTVQVVTHELGHNLGSFHTQNCYWQGGAIDDCYATEGTCPLGPTPVNGGTIMSYCHLVPSVGINFTNGFGHQPGDLIRFNVSEATCLGGKTTADVSNSYMCDAGSTLLHATPGGAATTCKWYASAFSDSAIHIGTTFQTPIISSKTEYFVSSYDPINSCESASRTKSTVDLVSVVNTFPYVEDFETSFGLWMQESMDDIDWEWHTANTSSSNTGPNAASSGNYYCYTESTFPNHPNKKGILISPCLDFTALADAELKFQYHLYGSGMGSLAVEISLNQGVNWLPALWNISGNQGNQWVEQTLDLSGFVGQEVRLRFVAITGNSHRSDIAIDFIRITGGSNPLPIDLLSFEAEKINRSANLKWEIIESEDLDFFEIEKSNDGNTFEKIGKSYSRENQNIYQFTDQNLFAGTNYYRLKIQEITGEFSYSPIRSIYNSEPTISVYPNPFQNNFTVELYDNQPNKYDVILLDALGKTVYCEHKTSKNGLHQFNINLPQNLPLGVYFLKIESKSWRDVQVLIKN